MTEPKIKIHLSCREKLQGLGETATLQELTEPFNGLASELRCNPRHREEMFRTAVRILDRIWRHPQTDQAHTANTIQKWLDAAPGMGCFPDSETQTIVYRMLPAMREKNLVATAKIQQWLWYTSEINPLMRERVASDALEILPDLGQQYPAEAMDAAEFWWGLVADPKDERIIIKVTEDLAVLFSQSLPAPDEKFSPAEKAQKFLKDLDLYLQTKSHNQQR